MNTAPTPTPSTGCDVRLTMQSMTFAALNYRSSAPRPTRITDIMKTPITVVEMLICMHSLLWLVAS
jgi:hypothetical protein